MRIAITTGDVNGIGIEIMLKSLYEFHSKEDIEFCFYGNKRILNDWIQLLGNSAFIENDGLIINQLVVPIVEIESDYSIEPGKISIYSGKLAANALEKCVDDTLAKHNDAIVTLPIAKEAMYLTGWKYPGHTEMLAEKCGVSSPLMILFKDNIRAALATIHIPIISVPAHIGYESVYQSILKLNDSLINNFGIKQPRIAVLGLNPHAGENGNIGSEENLYIIPAINNAKSNLVNVEGPFPSDGYFAHKEYINYDAYLAMYHDQGLIPLKLLANGGGVNFTAGLPFIRTSPDHGTAFSIAGKGIADPQSTLDALDAAINLKV